VRLKAELYLLKYLTGRRVPPNIEHVLDKYPALRRFRRTVLYNHTCPICGRRFSNHNSVIVHLLKDRKCGALLTTLVNTVINLENYSQRAQKLESLLQQVNINTT